MKTVQRLLYKEIIQAVVFVACGFLALFVFFDLVEELQNLTRMAGTGFRLQHGLLQVALKAPGHLYELMPISVLIGTIFVMARLAQSSEFTILRTGGLEPVRALTMLLQLGLGFVLLTFLLGDYIAPWSERQSTLLKSQFRGAITTGQTGAWLKERNANGHSAVNVKAFNDKAHMLGVRIHQFNAQGELLTITQAAKGEFGEGVWKLSDVQQESLTGQTQQAVTQIAISKLPSLDWPTGISADMVAAALLSPEQMKIWDLFLYTRHLSSNNQNAQQYEIQLWRKVFYPLSCLVMLTLALPFAYLHFRSGQIAGHVFGGVMAGISFYLLNNVFGHIGNLQNWVPWITSAAPSLLYTLISLGAFAWMVNKQ
jgi:lipopolysaccharide export system permease protein